MRAARSAIVSGRAPERFVGSILAAVTVLASCSGGSTAPSSNPPERDGDGTQTAVDWVSCGAVECGRLEVPLDYEDPQGATIELALSRRPADATALGSLVMNPGGPGASGLFLVEDADLLLDPELLANFDIVSWDPRGVGESTAVDCVDDMDDFWAADRTPDSADERAELVRVSQLLAAGCSERSAELLPHLSSADTVADMDAIRDALGDEQLTYIGYSYGSFLGALYADRYPERVRALVLDGALDPSLSYADVARDQGAGFEGALVEFFEWCDDRSCAFGASSDAASGYDALVGAVDERPVAVGDRSVGAGEAELGVVAALYGGEQTYPTLARALEDLSAGDGSLLLSLADTYSGRLSDGTYSNENEAFYATGCIDGPAPESVDALDELASDVAKVAPRLGASGVWLGLPCVYWPIEPQLAPSQISASAAPPILVLGTRGDPATPASWAESLAAQLESGVLVRLDAAGHVASGRGFECIDAIVRDYLLDLQVPAADVRCSAG